MLEKNEMAHHLQTDKLANVVFCAKAQKTSRV